MDTQDTAQFISDMLLAQNTLGHAVQQTQESLISAYKRLVTVMGPSPIEALHQGVQLLEEHAKMLGDIMERWRDAIIQSSPDAPQEATAVGRTAIIDTGSSGYRATVMNTEDRPTLACACCGDDCLECPCTMVVTSDNGDVECTTHDKQFQGRHIAL